MATEVSAARSSARRLAKWLVERGRPDEAVQLLAAWAAQGPNDEAGQQVLAEALRIDPSAKEAQMAFERMEGLEGDHTLLDQAIARFGAQQLEKLEQEAFRPTFRRAQMGFNTNINFRDRQFHLQTEDSGLDAPHVITHLFADGGRIIKSHKRSYADHVNDAKVGDFVRDLMRGQHLEMAVALREGQFDAIIDGQAVGGVEVLVDPPNVDIKKFKKSRKPAAEAARPSAQVAVSKPKTAAAKPLYTLSVMRSLSGGPECYDVTDESAIIGSQGPIGLPGEHFCHPTEAVLSHRKGKLFLEDLEGGNGVFLRIHGAVQVEFGDEFAVGDQLLRVEQNPRPDDLPDPDPTYFYSSPKWPSAFRVLQIFEGGAAGACVVARGNSLQIGSVVGDLVFSDDKLVAAQHCLVEEQAGSLLLTDLGAQTGTFVRVAGEQELKSGDELLVGRTHLVVTFA